MTTEAIVPRWTATGKRKTSIARVIMTPGTGEITCNGKPLADYLGRKTLVVAALQPFAETGTTGQYDVVARLDGGGPTGQAEALRHAIARALTEVDENLRPELKRKGLLVRDARVKERKKAGLKGARKRPQFSKR
jgi:small subunit ribosomal protein S9